MAKHPWSFTGTDYSIIGAASGREASLRWGDLLSFPQLSPLATSSFRAADPAARLPGFPEKAQKRFRTWNRTGSLQGVPPSRAARIHESGILLPSFPEERGADLSWGIECRSDHIIFSAAFENHTETPIRVHALAPLAGTFQIKTGPVSRWRFFKMSSNTTTPSGSVCLAGSERNLGIRLLPVSLLPGPVKRMFMLSDEHVSHRRGVFSSQWFTLLVHQDSGASMLLGFLGTERHFSTLRLDASRGYLQAAALAEGCELAPGERFHAHRLIALFGKSPHACIERYLDELCGTVRPRFPSVSLWGSWYTGFYDRFQWKDLEDNLEAVSGAPQKIEFFQLDDGYQKAVGDWTETEPCLPEGLEGFARTVREAGLKPGVWVAPFSVGRDSNLCRDHPDWLVKGGNGKPVRAGFIAGRFRLRPYYALDLTMAPVQDWLTGLFRTLVAWGFQLFKLDFLAAGTVPGIRENRGVTAAEAYRMGLTVIREAVGDLPLLGALAPQMCGAGIMDIQRVSTDSSFGRNTWYSPLQRIMGDSVTPCVRNNLRNNFTRSFLGDRTWTNDCDAILHGGFSPSEQKTHQVSNLLLGGVFQVGFDLRREGYPWEELAELQAYHPWMRVVPDLFEREFPREALIGARDRNGSDVLLYLLINPTDRICTMTLRDPSPHITGREILWEQGREWWADTAFTAKTGDTIPLPSRDCRLFEIPLR